MGVRLRSWWQRVRKLLEIFVILAGCIVVIALLVVIVLAYIFNVNVPGLHGKTLWDWLQLLIIPLVLAVIALLFNRATTRTEQKIAAERCKLRLSSRHDSSSKSGIGFDESHTKAPPRPTVHRWSA